MKYLFWILTFCLSCKGKNDDNCPSANVRVFSIYKNTASINLPEELLSLKDTLRNNFEYDSLLLYNCRLYSHDSLSSAFIKVRDNPLSPKGFVDYANEVQHYYKSLFRYDDGNYLSQHLDTLESKKLFKFVFLSKRDSSNIAFGGLMFYVNKIRFEVFVNFNERNFGNAPKQVECVFNSLTINK